jgi:stage V sporulation protein B
VNGVTADPASGRTDFGRDVAALTGIRLGGVGAGFLTAVTAARLLGPEALGVGGVAQTLATIAALVGSAGLSMATIYLLRRDASAAARTTGALAGLGLVLLIVAAAAGVLAAVTVGVAAVPGLVGSVVLVTGLLAAATVGVEVAGAGLLGHGLNRLYAISDAIRSTGILVATVIVLLVNPTATGFVLGIAVGLIAAATFAAYGVARAVGWIRPFVDRRIWGDALRFGLRGQIGNILGYVALRLDLVLVAGILGAAPAGIYLVATRVAEVVTQIANAASMLLFPAVARQDRDAGTAFTARTVRVVVIAVVAAAIAVGIGSWLFLPLVFGAEYAAGLPALGLLLVAAIPLSVGRLLGSDLKGRGRPGLVSIAAVLGLVITVFGNLALLPPWGITGAAAVSIAAYGANAIALALAYRSVTGGALGQLVPRPADAVAAARAAAALVRRRQEPAGGISRTPGGGTPPSGPA